MPAGALVEVAEAEEDGGGGHGERRRGGGAAECVGRSSENPAAVADLLAERGPGPDEAEPAEGRPRARGDGLRAGRRDDRRPDAFRERLDDDPERDAERRRAEGDREEPRPGGRPPEADRREAAVAQPVRDEAEDEEEGHLVREGSPDVVAEDESGADEELHGGEELPSARGGLRGGGGGFSHRVP